jgi:polysaccharide export outer membrane protein
MARARKTRAHATTDAAGAFDRARRYAGALAMLAVLVASLSCATRPPAAAGTDVREPGEPTAADLVSPTGFRLGVGDEISVGVWRNDELDRIVRVDPAGDIHLPLAGAVRAEGKTLSDLRDEITARLATYLVKPMVDVNIVTIRSREVHVLGEVETPGTVELDRNLVVWEALARAGGFTRDANERRVLLVRRRGSEATFSVLDIQMKKLAEHGTLSAEHYLQSGDIVYVPTKAIASVETFMRRLQTVLQPFLTIQTGIVLWPEMVDALEGESAVRPITVGL